MVQSKDPKIAAELHLGMLVDNDEVEQALRTLQGTLSLFANISIDFEADEVAWIAETAEEEARLNVHSFERSIAKEDIHQPRKIGFDLVARAVAAASAVSDYEIPLSFLRRGHEAVHADRCIEAYHSFFFFLETQFAAGYSDPKKVKKYLKETPSIREVLPEVRQNFIPHRTDYGDTMPKLMAMSDEELIDHLVDMRGHLHHHAKARKGVWHPDKQRLYRSESLVLSAICHNMALQYVIPRLFEPSQNAAISRDAVEAGAVTKFEFRAKKHGVGLPIVGVIGRTPTNEMLQVADLKFREKLKGRLATVGDYTICSDDGREIFAAYSRFLAEDIAAREEGMNETNS